MAAESPGVRCDVVKRHAAGRVGQAENSKRSTPEEPSPPRLPRPLRDGRQHRKANVGHGGQGRQYVPAKPLLPALPQPGCKLLVRGRAPRLWRAVRRWASCVAHSWSITELNWASKRNRREAGDCSKDHESSFKFPYRHPAPARHSGCSCRPGPGRDCLWSARPRSGRRRNSNTVTWSQVG